MPGSSPTSSSPPARDADARPTLAQRYVLREKLGEGGMGVVYRVLDRSTGEERVLKRIRVRGDGLDAFYLAALKREYQALASLQHPRIVRVYEYGVDAEGPYYTMELLSGRDLRDVSPIAWRQACAYLRDIASSLSLLHCRRLLHLDLGPGNVRTTDDGHCKLLDFGALAEFGYPQHVIGTPPMVSPEALHGGMLDQRSDLYALGALAYWMLTGRHAFPARHLHELPELWHEVPPPPSSFADGVPRALDELVLALLSQTPSARLDSAARVIAELERIALLEPENKVEQRRLVDGLLWVTRFVGRDSELRTLGSRITAALESRGGGLRVEGLPGSGRTRLLEETGVRAQLAGATVLRVDASIPTSRHAVTRALVLRAADALPEVTRVVSQRYAMQLQVLGPEVVARTGCNDVAMPGSSPTDSGSGLDDWFIEVSRIRPLVLEVDNVEFAGDASLGVLSALVRRSHNHALLIVLADTAADTQKPAKGLATLRESCQTVPLASLSRDETLELVRSTFGDAPNTGRFADWIYGATAGGPLYCIELLRLLAVQGVLQHEGGIWILPATRPAVTLPDALGDILWLRIAGLSEHARDLARCLSVQRQRATPELCRLLVEGCDPDDVLDELVRADVLQREQGAYRFSSVALREVLVGRLSQLASARIHPRLGRAFEQLSKVDLELPGVERERLVLEAGWHFMKGTDEGHGAALISELFSDPNRVQSLLMGDLRLGEPAQAALEVFKRERRGRHARMPLLSVVCLTSFFEDAAYADKYGDEGLDLFEHLTGMHLAVRTRKVLGAHLSLAFGLFVGWLRFLLAPKSDRPYSFYDLITMMVGSVTALAGTSAIRLDADRAGVIARVLSPFACLPDWFAPVGLYQFCTGIQQIAREHQAEAFATFDRLAKCFASPTFYRGLPDAARFIFLGASHFARGAFAIFRADSEAALESANVLEGMNRDLYRMIACQLRYLYRMNRGEFSLAAPHREQVEVYAAQLGSAWQVECWEPAALIPLYLSTGDVVALNRCSHQLAALAPLGPGMRRYARLGNLATLSLRNHDLDSIARLEEQLEEELARAPARSFIGWSAVLAAVARVFHFVGQYERARESCERALSLMSDADRSYVSLFLEVDIQAALADAGLGRISAALARIDAAIARFAVTQHPLTLGLLHEARARIAWAGGRNEIYLESLGEVGRWYLDTNTPALVAKYERLAELRDPDETMRQRRPAAPPLGEDETTAERG